MAAGRVFDKPDLVVVTTEHNIGEVLEYLPLFAARYKLSEEFINDTFAALPLEVYSEVQYSGELSRATELLGRRDPDDVALAALALTLRIPIWSNDRDFHAFPFGSITTAQLLKRLGV